MPRLRNTLTGSIVNVDDLTAAHLGSEWEPVKESAPEKKAEPRKTTVEK